MAVLAALALLALQGAAPTELQRFQSSLEDRDPVALAQWYDSTPRWGFVRSSRVVSDWLEGAGTVEQRIRAEVVAEALADEAPGALFARALGWSEDERAHYRALARDVRELQGARAMPPPPAAELDGLLGELRELAAEGLLLKPLGSLSGRLLDAGRDASAHGLVEHLQSVAAECGAVWSEAWAAEWSARRAWRAGDLVAAAGHFARAVELDRLFGDGAYRVGLLADLATVELSRGELEAGMRATDEARELAEGLGNPALLRRVLYVEASTYLDLGELQTALAICLELADGPSGEIDTAQVRLDLLTANILSDVGRLESAISFAEIALQRAQLEAIPPEDRGPLSTEAELTLGLYLGDAGRTDESLALLERARGAFEASGDRRGVGWAEKNRGWVLAREGEVGAALVAFETGRVIGREVGAPFLEGWCALGIAETDPAGDGFDDAIATAHDVSVRLRDRHLSWRAAAAEGLRARALGDLPAALEAFEQAVWKIEAWRGRLDAPGLLVHFLREKSDPYRAAAFAAAHLGDALVAFSHAERLRRRVFSESRGRRDPVARRSDESEVRAQRLLLSRAEAVLRDGRASGAERVLAEAELEEAERQLRALHVRAAMSRYGSISSPERRGLGELSPSAGAVSTYLASSDLDVIVSYLVGEGETLAFVLRTDERLELSVLPVGRPALEAWIDRIRGPMEALGRGELDLANLGFDVGAARALRHELIDPVGLRPGESVGLVVDDVLAALPFEALVVSGEPDAVDPARPFAALEPLVFLGDLHTLAMLPSSNPGRPWRAPSAGDELVAFVAAEGAGLDGDAREVAALRERSGELEVRLIADAEPADVVREGPGAFALHLVAHGRADAELPAHSHLRFGDVERLEAWHVESLDLSSAALAVLSACHTAEGSWYSGAGRQDLSRSFLLAGAARVVASRWAVDDRATALLMALFYAGLAEGQTPEEALCRARIALRTTRDPRGLSLAHPYFWAAWTVER
jgi:tetratricopeptide (TPR) repeat protein